MSMIKKAFTGFAIASLLLASSVPATNASELSDKVNANSSVSTSKHYDPSHPGHSHKCNNCQRTYNQQGDNGAYSSGSNICPYCGFANPVPNSPYPPTPVPNPHPYNPTPAPVPNPMPYPPTPVPNPYPNPNMPVSVDDLLRAWDAASSYQVADGIIVNGSSRVFSLNGLFRLVAKAHYRDSETAIIRNMERQGVICDVTPNDVLRCWDNVGNYSSADRVLIVSARFFARDINALTMFMRKSYYKSTEQALANMIPYASNGGYSNGYRSEVRSRINSELIAGETKAASTKTQISNEQAKLLETAKAQLANYKEATVNLTDSDIANMDLAKINEFTTNLKKGAYKKSEKLFSLKSDLVKKLKMSAMDNAEASEILNNLK